MSSGESGSGPLPQKKGHEFVTELKSFISNRLHDTVTVTNNSKQPPPVVEVLDKIIRKYITANDGQNSLDKLGTNLELGSGTGYSAASCIKYVARLHGLTPGSFGVLLDQLKCDTSSARSDLLFVKWQISQALKYAVQAQPTLIQDVETIMQALSSVSREMRGRGHDVKGKGMDKGPSDECRAYLGPKILEQLIECVAIKISKGHPHALDSSITIQKLVARLQKYVAMLDGECKGSLLFKMEKLGVSLTKTQPSTPPSENIQNAADSAEGANVNGQPQTIDLDDELNDGDSKPALIYQRGLDIVVSCARKGKDVKADAVRVQQTVTSVYKENMSEKSEIERINLSKALSTNRTAVVNKAQTVESVSSPTRSNDGSSIRSYFRTTAMEVEALHDHAAAKNALCQDDLDYLNNKLCGFKLNLWDAYSTTDTQIAATFAIVAKTQVLNETIQNGLADAGFGRKLGSVYDEYRVLLLKSLQLCANRASKGRLSPHTTKVLSEFRETKACTDDMKKILWQIFVADDNNLEANFRVALEDIQQTAQVEHSSVDWNIVDSKLDYIRQQVVNETRAKSLEADNPFFDRLLEMLPSDTAHSHALHVRAKVAQLIDDLLDHSHTPPLAPETLKMIVEMNEPAEMKRAHLEDKDKEDDWNLLVRSLVKCVLKTINKCESDGEIQLDPSVLDFLVRVATAGKDSKLEALVMVTLGNLVIQNPRAALAIPAPGRLAYKLGGCDHVDSDGNVFLEAVMNPKDKAKKKDKVKGEKNQEQVPLEKEVEGHTYVSAMAANILLHAMFKAPVNIDKDGHKITVQLLEHLITGVSKALDKNTRILCSECLFLAATAATAPSGTLLFTERMIWLLAPFTQDPVLDVRVFCSATYTTALHSLLISQQQQPGTSNKEVFGSHALDELAQLYALEKLAIGTQDYTQYVNEPILHILQAKATVVSFSADIFQLLTVILRLEGANCNGELVLDILYRQISRPAATEGRIPGYVLDAVQDRFASTPSTNHNQELGNILRILECAPRQHKLSLSQATLHTLAKAELQSVELQELSSAAFFNAILLQDVPDSLFTSFDLNFVFSRWLNSLKAVTDESTIGFASKLAPPPSAKGRPDPQFEAGLIQTAETYLRKLGLKLSSTSIQVFQVYFQDTASQRNLELVLACLTTAAENGQVFPERLVQLMFASTSASKKDNKHFPALLRLALAMVQNNQRLPSAFLDPVCALFCEGDLKELFSDDEVSQKTLAILTKCVQNSNPLSCLEKVVHKFCQGVAVMESSQGVSGQRLEILSALASLVNSGRNDEQLTSLDGAELKRVFRHAIKSGSAQMIETGVHGFIGLQNNKFIQTTDDNDAADVKLLTKIQRSTDNSGVRDSIADFLQSRRRGMKPGLQASLNLSDIANKSNSQFIQDLPMLLKLEGAEYFETEGCQRRIQTILHSETDENIVSSALSILTAYPHPTRLPTATLEAVAFVNANTNPNQGQNQEMCRQLLEAALAPTAPTANADKEAQVITDAVLTPKLISYLQLDEKLAIKLLPSVMDSNSNNSSKKSMSSKIKRLLSLKDGGTSKSKATGANAKMVELVQSESSKWDDDDVLDSVSLRDLFQILPPTLRDFGAPFVNLLARSVLALDPEQLDEGLSIRIGHILQVAILGELQTEITEENTATTKDTNKKGKGLKSQLKSFFKSGTKKLLRPLPKAKGADESESDVKKSSSDREPPVQNHELQLRALKKLLANFKLEKPAHFLSALKEIWCHESKISSEELRVLILQVAQIVIGIMGEETVPLTKGTTKWLARIAEDDEVALLRRLAVQALKNSANTNANANTLDEVTENMRDFILEEVGGRREASVLGELVKTFSDDDFLFFVSLTNVDFVGLQKMVASNTALGMTSGGWRRILLLSDTLSALWLESPTELMRAYETLIRIQDKFGIPVETPLESKAESEMEDVFCWLTFRLSQLDGSGGGGGATSPALAALEHLALLTSAEIMTYLKDSGQICMDKLKRLGVQSWLEQKMGAVSRKLIRLLANQLYELTSAPGQSSTLTQTVCSAIKDTESVNVQEFESLLAALIQTKDGDGKRLEAAIKEIQPHAHSHSCTLSELVIVIQTHALLSQNSSSDSDNKPRIVRLIKALLRSGVEFEDISRVTALRPKLGPVFEYAISQAFQYKVNGAIFANLVTRLGSACASRSKSKRGGGELRTLCDQVISQGVFEGKAGVKDIHQVVNEFRLKNARSSFKWSALKERFVKAGYEWELLKLKVMQVLEADKPSKICPRPRWGNICDWSEDDVREWAKRVQKRHGMPPPILEQVATHVTNVVTTALGLTPLLSPEEEEEVELTDNEYYFEALMVARRAMKLHRNFDLTRVQVLSCLLALQKLEKDKGKGQLQQVATGSGKSAIVAILSTIKALEGKRVDVYTSSPVLAERDSKEWAPFYALFHLTSDHNADRGNYLYGPKGCYSKHIVYGDCAQFQFDHLRDGYSGLGTLGGRPLQYAIVDEVDAMLLDDISKLARLSTQLPGMDTIQVLYHLLWDRLLYLQSHLFALKGFHFYLQGTVTYKPDGLIEYRYAHHETGALCLLRDLFHFITSSNIGDLHNAGIYPVDDVEEYVRTQLESYVKALVKEPDEGDSKAVTTTKGQKIVQVPKYLRSFVEGQIGVWVESALTALKYEENINYVVDGDAIKPVDYLTTGVVQANTNWNNGLHQFLGLKHSVKIQPETVTTNFLSNLAMFEKYGANLVGFSGTLGSESGRAVLYNTYKVKVLTLPETHYKRYIQFPDIVVPTWEQWQREIVLSCRAEADKGRGVLVICENIRAAQELGSLLTSFKCKVKLYVRNDEEALEERIERMHPGDIIVATNLAGRGTDIKTLNVEEYGGLHVCLTFLPQSGRIQEQAFGRTSRQGKRGTGQLIVVAVAGSSDSEVLKADRDDGEKTTLETLLAKELPGIRMRGKLFARFCDYFADLRVSLRENCSTYQKAKNLLKSAVNTLSGGHAVLDSFTLPIKETLILQSVEERWAMFLRSVDKMGEEEAMAAYDVFVAEIEAQLLRGQEQIMVDGRNVFYFTQLGNFEYLEGRLDTALKHFHTAIDLDSEFSAGARIGVATTLLKQGTDPSHKESALAYFKDSLALLYEEMGYINAVQTLIHKRSGTDDGVDQDSSLMRQLTEKANLLGYFINTVDANSKAVERSLRRVRLTASNPREGRQESRTLPDAPNANQRVLNPNSYKQYTEFSLEFHDLTAPNGNDQAVNSLPSDSWFKSKIKCQIGCKAESPDMHKLLANDEQAKKLLKEVPNMSFELHDVSMDTVARKLKFDLDSFGGKLGVKLFDVQVNGNTNDLKVILKNVGVEGKPLQGKEGRIELTSISETDKSVLTKIFDASEVDAAESYAQAHSLTSLKFMGGLSSASQLNKLCGIIVDSTTQHPLNSFPTIDLTLHTSNSNLALKGPLVEFWESVFLKFCKSYTLHLHGMNTSQANTVIPILRAQALDFVLQISGLDFPSAQSVYSKASIEQEKMEAAKEQHLADMFMAAYIPILEIHLLRDRGLSVLITFNEKNFIPWCSLLTVCGIAAAQVALGGYLLYTGFGVGLGVSLITEGMSDFQTAYRIYTTRQFSWSAYGTQKAVSLTISALTLGMSGLKDGAKGLKVLGSSALKSSGNTAANAVLTTSGKNLGTLAMKKIGVKAMETVGRIGLKELTDKLAGFCFEQIRPIIQNEVSARVQAGFGNTELMRLLCQKYAMQKVLAGGVEKPGESRFQQKIVGIVRATTNPKAGTWTSLWESVGSPLAVGILSDPQYVGSPASTAFLFWGALTGFKEIGTVTARVLDEIRDKLEKEPDQLQQVLRSVGISCESDLVTSLQLNQDPEKSSFDFGVVSMKESHFKSAEEYKAFKEVILKLKKLEKRFGSESDMEMSGIQKKVVDLITDHIVKVANSHLVSPVMSRVGGQIIAHISQQIQDQFIVSEEQNAPGTTGRQTLDQQILGNAKSYMQSYRKVELEILVEKITEEGGTNESGKEVPASVLEQAKKVSQDAPIDSTLFAIQVKKHGLNVKVVTDPNYVPTPEEKASGTRIVVFTPGETPDSVGHYALKTEDGTGFVDVTGRSGADGNEKNDCGFQVLGELLDTSAEDVRIDAATNILTHPDEFQEIAHINGWLESRYPQEVNSLLQRGGRITREPIYEDRVGHGPHGYRKTKSRITIPLDGEEGERTRQSGPAKEEADRQTELTRKQHVQKHVANQDVGGTGDESNIVAGTHSSNSKQIAIDKNLKKVFNEHKGEGGNILVDYVEYKDETGRVVKERFTYSTEGNEELRDTLNQVFGSAIDPATRRPMFTETPNGFTVYLRNVDPHQKAERGREEPSSDIFGGDMAEQFEP